MQSHEVAALPLGVGVPSDGMPVRQDQYKDGDYNVIDLTDEQRYELQKKIECDLTVPQIWETMKEYTYEQLYDTILCDAAMTTCQRIANHSASPRPFA